MQARLAYHQAKGEQQHHGGEAAELRDQLGEGA